MKDLIDREHSEVHSKASVESAEFEAPTGKCNSAQVTEKRIDLHFGRDK